MAEKATNEAKQQNPEFGIQRLYLKDLSFESPKSPKVFLEEWRPELHMDIGTKTEAIGDDLHEVVLTVTVTVKMKEDTIFLVEAKQAGIFSIKNFPKDQIHPMLGSYCPNILYPYIREAITDVVVKGGFPQLYLSPVNFDALYEKHRQQDAAQKAEKKEH